MTFWFWIDSLTLKRSNDSTDFLSRVIWGRIKGRGVGNGGESSGHIPTWGKFLSENSKFTQSSASHRLKYRLKKFQRTLNLIVWNNSFCQQNRSRSTRLPPPPAQPWQIKFKNIIVNREFGRGAKLVIVKVM